MTLINRQWILSERPRGNIDDNTFTLVEQSLPELAEGEARVKTLYLGFDPAQRGWMDDIPSYLPPVALGDPMRASGVGQIIASRNPGYPEGQLVTGLLGWQEYVQASAEALKLFRPVPPGTPPTHPLTLYGSTAMTAYFGLLDIGRPKSGETVVVTGAAGATGSIVCQIAKQKGCRVIGIAGGREKCQWLTDACGVDHAIDYKAESINKRLRELCPEGINLCFDNVGGSQLETLIGHMAFYGRIVMCGAIASYNDVDPSPGPRNLFKVITHRLRLQGFILLDFLDQAQRFQEEFIPWVEQGKIAYREDIQQGFEHIPATLQRLFDGKNQGKQLIKLADPE